MNYTPPAPGLPAPDPMPMASYQQPKKKRKRYNPKNPWYHAYSGDQWRRPHARETYRFYIHNWRGMQLCRVTRHKDANDVEGSLLIHSEFRLAGPDFKRIAVENGLRPVKRPDKYRKGLSIKFWDWPTGFVKD